MAGVARAEVTPQQLQKECDAKIWQSCVELGYRYADGEGVPKDVAKSVALHQRACEAGYGGGCHHLGQMFLKGESVPKDVARAVGLLERACDYAEGDACIELQLMYEKGEVVPKDQKRADAYYERGCDLEAMICVMVFNSYLEIVVEGCDEKKYLTSCFELGTIYLNGHSYLKPDEAAAAPWFHKACDGGYAAGCALLGWIHDHGTQTKRDPAKAAGFYQKACNGKYAWGCQQIGILYLKGEGVARDDVRGTELLRRACDARIPDTKDACDLLVVLAPKKAGCPVAKVRIGTDTFASVQRDIQRRGGNASAGSNNGKPVLNALSGDYSDVGPAVMNVGYTFEAAGETARLIGVTIVTHASSNAEFEKLRAARQAASAAVKKAADATCTVKLVPNADTFYVYEIYELRNSP